MGVSIVVLVAVVGVVAADIGIGYQYQVPHTSYGVPSYQHASGGNRFNVGSAGPSYNYKGQSSNAGYQGLAGGVPSGGPSSHHGAGFASSNQGYQGANYQTGYTGANTAYRASNNYEASSVQQPAYQYHHQNHYQNSYQTQYQASAGQQHQDYYKQIQQQPAQVFKHFYVHAAPEEPEAPKFRQPPVLPPPQKHYKIIFIKTPTQVAAAPQYIPVAQQNEEKTIVYVLVNKPEEAQDIVLPKIEQKPPSKPEVFFIKYNSKEGSQGVINNIVSDYSKGQSGVAGVQSLGASEGAVVQGGHQAVSLASTGDSGSYATSQAGESLGQGHVAALSSASSVSSGGFESNLGASEASSGGSVDQSSFSSSVGSDNFNTLSTSQGVPHETYGPPKFREN